MFRLGARRCGRLQAGILATPSILLRPRAVLPASRLATATQTLAPFKNASWSLRAYSSEAVAAEPPASVSSEKEKFAELADLGVDQNLIRAVTEGLGYEAMTPVQAKTITPALKGTDIVAQARTGTGKTLAFLLPIFQRMLADDPSLVKRSAKYRARSDDIRGIVLSPTRELAEQIAVEAKNLARHTGIVVQTAVGGTSKRQMLRKTQREGCHLLVATPGRLYDLLSDEYAGVAAPRLSALVLDEADRILDVGFEKQIHDILKMIPDPEEKVRQTMLVSATIPEDVIQLARSMVRRDDFQFVQTIGENEALTHDRVPQHLVSLSSWATMFPTLFEIIDRESERLAADPAGPEFKALVYLNTTAATDFATQLGLQKKRNGEWKRFWISGIQSKMTQDGRQRAADGFRRARSGILFSSDVTARGMDFPNVSHVIQIDAPRERETYIHRIGRTARQGKDGQAWLLLPPSSVGSARRLLQGLPLKPNHSFSEIADASLESEGNIPPSVEDVQTLVQALPQEKVFDLYTSLVGAANNKRMLAEDLRDAWTLGFGFENSPAVSRQWAEKVGLGTGPGVNLNAPQFGGRSDRSSERSSERRQDSSSGDAFDDMRQNIRSDKPFGRQGFGRRDGNFRGRSTKSRW